MIEITIADRLASSAARARRDIICENQPLARWLKSTYDLAADAAEQRGVCSVSVQIPSELLLLAPLIEAELRSDGFDVQETPGNALRLSWPTA